MCITLWLVVSLILICPVSAQDIPVNWHWAIRESTGELLSFNAAGVVHSLAQLPLPDQGYYGGIRLSPDMAIALFASDAVSVDELAQIEMHILTSDSADRIQYDFDTQQLALTADQQYDFFRNTRYAARRLGDSKWLLSLNRDSYYGLPLRLLVNLTNHSAKPLFDSDLTLWNQYLAGSPVPDLDNPIRHFEFTNEGTDLRYVLEDRATETLTLINYDLLSDTKRVIASTPDLEFIVHAAPYGERWLFSRLDWSEGLLVCTLNLLS